MDSPSSAGRPRGFDADLQALLVIDKPLGISSHAVVGRVRRWTGVRRVGHVGTLDPLATGVLVLCLGKATRIAEYLMEGDKVYRATVRFGVETDSWDGEGVVVAEADASTLTTESIAAALPALTGEIMQTPPMFSALKRDGRPLYRLARRGLEVEREARRVTISRLALLDWTLPDAELDIACSRGTYVRALAHDLGAMLGVGAYLRGLARLAVGPFRLEEAVGLEELAQAVAAGTWREWLLPVSAGLAHLPAVTVGDDVLHALTLGRQVALAVDPAQPLACAYDAAGDLAAVLAPDAASGLWQPRKVLLPGTEGDARDEVAEDGA